MFSVTQLIIIVWFR